MRGKFGGTRLPQVAILVLVCGASCKADLYETFQLSYSGADFGNTATASATITLDLTLLNNPGLTQQSDTPFVTDFAMSIRGASSGNGDFTFSDFNGGPNGGFLLNTNGGLLDFNQDLIGQPTDNDPFGTPSLGNGGDFNIFSNGTNLAAPYGNYWFRITTNNGSGDNLNLTHFSRTSVPSPGSFSLMGLGLFLANRWVRRKRSVQVETRA